MSMSINNFGENSQKIKNPFDDSNNIYKNRELIYKKIPNEFFENPENFKINKNLLSMSKMEIEYKTREVNYL